MRLWASRQLSMGLTAQVSLLSPALLMLGCVTTTVTDAFAGLHRLCVAIDICAAAAADEACVAPDEVLATLLAAAAVAMAAFVVSVVLPFLKTIIY